MLPRNPLDGRHDPRHMNSWPYWAVRQDRNVRLGLLLVAITAGLVAWWLIRAAAPAMPGNSGTNTVQRLADPVLLHDYAASGVRAMASSDRWLGLAVPGQGLTVLSMRNGVPVHRSSTEAIDVTEGPAAASMLALRTDQGIDLVQRSPLGWNDANWLPPPAAPRWKAAKRFESADIMYAELDDAGLLLAARDAGIARYLFDTRAGLRVAMRSWQQPPTPAVVGLQWVGGTARGFWLHGRGGDLRFLDRASLAVEASRSCDLPGISAPSYSKAGDWLGAIAGRGVAWTYDALAGWRGPWFGAGPDGGPDSAAQVTVARLGGGMLWLGTRKGLFGYSTASHAMGGRVLEGSIRDLEPVGDSLVAASDSGVHIVGPQGEPKQLSDHGPGAFSLSPDGRTLAVRAGASGAKSVAVHNTGDLAKPALLGDTLWHDGDAPAVRVVLEQADGALLATDRGCLRYRLAGPVYEDCSQARLGKEPNSRRKLRDFSRLEQHDGALLANADGHTLAAASGTDWVALRLGKAAPRRATAAAGRVFGLDDRGGMYRFSAYGTPEVSLIGGRSEFSGHNTTNVGDLTGVADDWRMLLVTGSRLHLYASKTANWSTVDATAPPRSTLMVGNGLAWVTNEGELRTDGGEDTGLGQGGLSFDPRMVSAFAPVPGEQPVLLVGGPEGRVARYEIGRGRWSELGPPVPGAGGPVLQIESHAQGILARRAQGQAYNWDGHKWSLWPGAARGWARAGEDMFWRLDDQGITRSNGLRDASNATYSGGEQLKSFAGRARFVWQASAERVALIADGAIGIFDRADDVWTLTPRPAVRPSAAVERKAGLLLLTPPVRPNLLSDGASRLGAPLPEPGRIDMLRPDGVLIRMRSADGPVRDIAASASGADFVWLLHERHAAEYQLVGDDALVRTSRALVNTLQRTTTLADAAAGNPAIAIDTTTPALLLAALDYGGQQLDWTVARDGGAQLSWRDRPELPVWCGRGGRLALQCPTAITVSADKQSLVVDTPAGRFRRSAKSFAFEGREGASAAPAPLTAGGFTWQIDGQGLAAKHDGKAIEWMPRGSGRWRLACDQVADIRRIDERTLALRTPAGVWSWSSVTQRGPAVTWPPAARHKVSTPALLVGLEGKQVIMEAFDGGPVFVDGRFFFDAIDDLRGYGGALFTIAGERALVQRDPAQPHNLLTATALPGGYRGAALRLEAGAASVMVSGPAGRIAPKIAGAGTAGWQPAEPPTALVRVGPFEFRPRPNAGWNVAYVTPQGTVELPTWWSRGRFAWDDEWAFGALDRQRVALATPLGITIRQASGSFELLLPSAGGHSAAVTARDGTRRLGTLFDGRRLLDDDAKVGPRLVDAGPELRQIATVEVAAGEHGSGFREIWAPQADAGPPLRSAINALPTSALLHAGRFVFDAPSAIGRLAADQWLAVSGCDTPAGCLLALYGVDSGGLALRSVTLLPRRPLALRAGSDGALFGLMANGSVHRIATNGRLGAADARTATEFIDGVQVSLDVSRLTWEGRPLRLGESGPRLRTSDGTEVPWLFEGNDVAFSFDVYDSIAGRRQANYDLAIATRYGVLLCPGLGAAAPATELVRACRMKPHARARINETSPRLRWHDGQLWLADGGAAIPMAAATAPKTSQAVNPFAGAWAGAHRVAWDQAGLRIDGIPIARSNNLFESGRRPIGEVVDWHYDAEAEQLWLGERSHGVFVVRLRPS